MTDTKTQTMEPNPALIGGPGAGAAARRLWLATRPKFFPASVLPVVVGTAWGFSVSGTLDIVAAVLALIATMAVHAASNVINDVGDEINGTDRANDARVHPFTGGSRFIQNDIMTLEQMRRWGIALFVIAAVPGLALVALKGYGVLLFGAIGIVFGVLYSLPGIQLSGRGIGEIVIACAFGVLPVTGAAWLQTGVVDPDAILLSIAVGGWVAAILLINEIPDRAADANAGKRTWPVRFGVSGARWLYVALHVTSGIAVGWAVWRLGLPFWSLVPPAILLAVAIAMSDLIERARDDSQLITPAIKTTLGIHTLGCVWLAALVLLGP